MTHNLSPQPTPFIGRADELAEIARLLADPTCRLLTLVGAGGIGKTRLAIQAAEQPSHFAHGVYFVPLQPLTSPDFIVAAIADALRFQFYSSNDPKQQILDYLHDKAILLVLDNFEHLLEGSAVLVEILNNAAEVKLLVTSRERLNLVEEWMLNVSGLDYPSGQDDTAIGDYSAVQLFVQRAQQVQVKFSLNENAEVVKQICQQVEGMPLGLELAASWLRMMSAKQITAYMTDSLDFLTTPLRNVPERHRSIRSVFEQSWNLLSPAEQNVLMRLSVFRGGFDLEAAEQVAEASLPLLAALTDKSLIRWTAEERYDLHELLRQYTADKLLDAGEVETTAQRHFAYFLKLAEQVEAHNFGREQVGWYDRVETELDNIRAALSRSLETEASLRLAAALGWFFSERCYWIEGHDWLERTLAANMDAPASLRAKAFHLAGALEGHMDNHKKAEAFIEQALTLSRAENDRWNIAWSLSQLGLYGDQNPEQNAAVLQESLTLFRALNDPMGLCHTLIRFATRTSGESDYVSARAFLAEAAVIAQEADDKITKGWVAFMLGEILWFADNDVKQAKAYFETCLVFFEEAHFPGAVVNILGELAQLEALMDNEARAERLYRQALVLLQKRVLHNSSLEIIFVGLGGIALAHGELNRAGILLGAAENMLVNIYTAPGFTILNSFQKIAAEVNRHLEQQPFADAFAKGKVMTRSEAIAYALADKRPADDAALGPPDLQALTKREIEILRLMAEGLSNRDIAERLFLTSGTVKWYLSEIYSKLGVKGRVQAVARARELALLA